MIIKNPTIVESGKPLAPYMMHVVVIPCHENCLDEPVDLNVIASTKEEALQVVAERGYTIIPENNGGDVQRYDKDDAPRVFGTPRSGWGAIGITVEP